LKKSIILLQKGIAVFAAVSLTLSLSAQSEAKLIFPGEDGKLVYVKHANTAESNADNLIIDFSNCGYMGGGISIPDVPVKIIVYPQLGDDRKRIQDAISYVSSLDVDENGFRGAVLLKAGTYEVDEGLTANGDALKINTSGVVLRGEGQGSEGTILRTTLESKHPIIATRPANPSVSTLMTTRISDSYVGSGTKGFHVENASGLNAGDIIHVRFTPNQTWLDEIYANNYMSDGDLDWDIGTYTINYERKITSVDGDSISIHSPIILPMQSKFGGGEVRKISRSKERISQVGVENLRLVGTGITSTCAADNPNRLKTAVHFDYTENSWIRGITVLHTSNSLFKTWNSHYITIEDCASIIPLGPKRAGYRYTFYFDAASSHNLCQRTYTDDGRHDYVLGPRIPGPNVFLDGFSARGGTQGPHQRWATGTLFDNLKLGSLIALEHRGSSGSGHSWAGIQSTIWNTESPSVICDAPSGHMNYAIGNTGNEILSQYIKNTRPGVYRGHYDNHGSHVTTRSLYLKQLEDRLGAAAVENIAIPEQLAGNIYHMLDGWRGNGALREYNITRLAAPENLTMTDLAYQENEKFVMLGWTDNVANELNFVLERSADGGGTYSVLAQLPANTTSYTDQTIENSAYHYRIKSVNETMESGYIYLLADLLDEALYSSVTFRLNISDVTDLYEGGDVWVLYNDGSGRYEMSDENGDQIYSLTLSFMVGKTFLYRFAYQNGADSATNMHTENITGDCTDSNGKRSLTVPSYDIILSAYLFGSCDEALPDGVDVTDLEGTIIFGSNDDEPWIDGSTGSGSPPNERVEKLIDNDVQTKYLVRDILSTVDIKTNRFTNLNGYTITSANDDPSRDPRDWRLLGFNTETNKWEELHQVIDNPVWDNRFKIRVWTFDNENWYHHYRLFITDINGDSQGLMQMAELQLFGEVGELTSVQSHPAKALQLYPNPASDYLKIVINDETLEEHTEIAIYDITGKQVWKKHPVSSTEMTVKLDEGQFMSGIYIVKLLSGSDMLVKKIIIE
jgi:hypothetical protein